MTECNIGNEKGRRQKPCIPGMGPDDPGGLHSLYGSVTTERKADERGKKADAMHPWPKIIPGVYTVYMVPDGSAMTECSGNPAT